ncbi:MAG: 2-phospho-L-lactate transferase [Acidimicrobiia bacterium]|nr:2-phospho-L-lactate transferase [Acidimicrobiia bacterium]
MVRVAALSGGVGGARMVRGLQRLLGHHLEVIVNVGDDERVYGLALSPDIDTVVYGLAGVQGPQGWGMADDRFGVMTALERFGVDTTFRVGDGDLATLLYRSNRLAEGATLTEVTREIAQAFEVEANILPVSNDLVRTQLKIRSGTWLHFQEYFVHRGHEDEVVDVRFEGTERARPAPGVLAAIGRADLVVIGPSNPPLSVWPILAVDGVVDALSAKPTICVSPLIGATALRGPADKVMASLGLPPGTEGVIAAYENLIDAIVVDPGDADEVSSNTVEVIPANTRIADIGAAERLGRLLLSHVR